MPRSGRGAPSPLPRPKGNGALAPRRGLHERGVVVAFDNDPGGRDAAVRAFGLLRAAGAWPTVADLDSGHDPASLVERHGSAALHAALVTAYCPLTNLVVDQRLDRWRERVLDVEGRAAATRHVAALIATLPPEHVALQVARADSRLGVDHPAVTGQGVDAPTRELAAVRDAGRSASRTSSRAGGGPGPRRRSRCTPPSSLRR